ncbi:MAG: SH3-like domain-containing protein [Candidatus Nanopelagicales bacterium]
MTGRFAVGDRVRVRRTAEPETINPRTPSYAKGVTGTIIAAYGVVANPLDGRIRRNGLIRERGGVGRNR